MSLTWISGPGTLTQKTHPFTTASGPNICWLLPSNAPQHGPFISDGVHAINQLPGRRPPQTTRVMSVSPPGQQSSIVRLPRDSLNQDTHSSPCLLLSTPQSLNLCSFGASFLLARPSQGALPGSVETLLQSTSIRDIMCPSTPIKLSEQAGVIPACSTAGSPPHGGLEAPRPFYGAKTNSHCLVSHAASYAV